jgi:hypothetical protein
MNPGSVDISGGSSQPVAKAQQTNNNDGELSIDRFSTAGATTNSGAVTTTTTSTSSTSSSVAKRSNDNDDEDNDINKKPSADEKKTRRKKKWKKPADKPSRPLSAYNLFFAEERARMLGDDAPTPEEEERKRKIHCKTREFFLHI